MTAITVDHLIKRYGSFPAVRDVSFGVPAGQVTALLGPNGAGKTTIIEILEGYLEPSAGQVRVLGTDPWHGDRAWRARIGLVLQSTSLDLQLTVSEALGLFGALFPRPRPVAEVLAEIDLAADAGTRIGALSGGQRRRVDLGLGIIGQPEMLFLDEPTTGLDPEARRRLWAVVEGLAAGGTTVLLTTHYLEEAQHLADRVIVLSEGRIVADATPDGLRAAGGAPVIRYHLPPSVRADDLPAALLASLDREHRVVSLPSNDVTGDLEALVGWARRNRVDLTGLEVAPPSLEAVYLALTSEAAAPGVLTTTGPLAAGGTAGNHG
ncbi:MAG TPA: ABC transporter ATP-binding protein [Streptosporangiaceae bacterium]|jgi:ABC-2 type transport system ATP-binding protein